MAESYLEIDVTTSRKTLMSTKEFVELKSELLDKMRLGNLDMAVINNELENMLRTMLKYMKAKLKRQKVKVKKAIKDIEVLKSANYQFFQCRLSDLNDEDTIKFYFDNIVIKIPSIEYIRNIVQGMIDKVEITNEQINSFVSFQLLGAKVFGGFTKKRVVYENNRLKEQIDEELNELMERLPNYEEVTTGIHIGLIYITFNTVVWECINNWWPKITSKEKRFDGFTLFLASGKDNCVKQCVEKLGGTWDPEKEFEEMIPQSKVITYIPINKMKYVRSLKDFMSDNDEDIKTDDCKNIARIVKSQGHMGVITKIKEVPLRKKYQSNKRLIIDGDETMEIFMDIESFTQELDNKNMKQIPYLVCWCSDDNIIKKTSGENCIKDFVSELLALSKTTKKIILYAWYGSGYDFQHILGELKSRCSDDRFIIRNSSIINGEIMFDLIDFKIVLKDPYLFLLLSLDKAAKSFNVLNKGNFPHTIIKGWEDLNRIIPNWVSTQRSIVEDKNDNKLGIVVKREITLNYETKINDKTILQKAIEYCEVDVLAMKEVWKKFKLLIKQNLSMEINEHTFTLSQLSMKLMEASLEKGVNLVVPSKDDYNFIKGSIYGGRVIAKNGVYNEKILYADVVSLYPSAMKLLKHPYGNPIHVKTRNEEKLGIYNAVLTHKQNIPPRNYLEFVPRRIDGRLAWNWFKKHEGYYHSYDLEIAKHEGYEIEVKSGIEYEHSGHIFNNYIDKLYKLKEEHSNCNCEEQPCNIRMIAKIALNGGGYGKFVQRPIDRDVLIVERDTVAAECEKLRADEDGKIMLGGAKINKPKFYNLDGERYDKMVIEKDEDPVYSTQLGVSILSGSRLRLYLLCKQFPGIEIIYSDTDSIYVKANSVNEEDFKNACNTQLGDLDNTISGSLDNTIDEMIIGGPKMYAYNYYTKENKEIKKLYCKGVPKDMLSYEQIREMVENNECITYEFNILKRKLVSIGEMYIEKRIKQTIGYKGDEQIEILDYL